MVSGYLAGRMAREQDWLRGRLEELAQIDRPSASDGERRAAEWLVERFAEHGAQARIEAETAPGTYWLALGIGGALGAVAALRGEVPADTPRFCPPGPLPTRLPTGSHAV